jgi:glycosyltransferase involved in cell wall biosynthesis
VRILLALPGAYTDPTSGAARSLRTLMTWLSEAGHACHVLCTARFDLPDISLPEHLGHLDVPVEEDDDVARFDLAGVSVTLVRQLRCLAPGARAGLRRYLGLLDGLLDRFAPDLLIAGGGSPETLAALRRAHALGVMTLFSVRNHGYEDRDWFTDADHVLTTSPYLSRVYREKIGLVSTGIPSPINWDEVIAPDDERSFVTFVNPSLHKGAAFFARLAAVLGERRPDIPILVIWSAADEAARRLWAAVGLGRFRHIVAGPPTDYPADYLALTRLLLVPSVFNEPFGRVAVEALINGIPPLVSDRGALPETVAGAGRVLPLPAWMTPTGERLPEAADVGPWFAAVCEWWDHPEQYAAASDLARRTAREFYAEAVLKSHYLDYFASLRRTGPPTSLAHQPGKSAIVPAGKPLSASSPVHRGDAS